MSGRPDIIYCLVRRGHVVHYHSDRSVFERWLGKDPWRYPPDECEIIPYVPASGVRETDWSRGVQGQIGPGDEYDWFNREPRW